MLPKDKFRESISEIQTDFNPAQIKEEKMMGVFDSTEKIRRTIDALRRIVRFNSI